MIPAGLLLLLGNTAAARPTDGQGLFAFSTEDRVEHWEEPSGAVRVHFSVEGPNQTLLTDGDGDGIPDYPWLVATTAADVLSFYATEGFRVPLAEADVGVDGIGGSDAFDIYLVDFGGSADGHYSVDACIGDRCAGHFVMENDFVGYGYPSRAEAVDILTSHELFHAVQAAYTIRQPAWMSEGTAVWAEWLYTGGTRDFLAFADAYLADAGRSIDRPPAGVATPFTYGTALFFGFLDVAMGAGTAVSLQEEMAGRSEEEALDAIEAVLDSAGATLPEVWAVFVEWNLATGARSGAVESYPFATDLTGPVLEREVDSGALVDDNRFYPLAATYYRWTHAGGEVTFVNDEEAQDLIFSLFPVVDGQEDGVVGEPVARWSPRGAGQTAIGPLDAGSYFLVGTFPERAAQSRKATFCLAGTAELTQCPSMETDAPSEPTGDGQQTPAGGCATSRATGSTALFWWLTLAGLWRRAATQQMPRAY